MKKSVSSKPRVRKTSEQQPMLFTANNYILLGVALLLLFIGYLGMYIEQEFQGFFSLYFSPILLIVGYIMVALSIIWRKKQDTTESHS